MEKFNFIVGEDFSNTRLDKFLGDNLRELSISREKIKKSILANLVTIAGEVINLPKYLITAGDDIEIEIMASSPSKIEATEIDLDIIYEDEDIIIINKQAGLTVHPGAGNHNDTMVNALLAYNKNLSKIGGLERPGIVHRLDKNTSGLIIVAKNDKAHLLLSKQLEERSLTREYVAIIWGMLSPDVGVVDKNIARSNRNRKLMEVVDFGGKEAITHYETEKIFLEGKLSLVKCKLETGRTHQIRVHLSHLGHSVFGDPEYGHHKRKLKKYLSLELQQQTEFLTRQALHARRISFIHPQTKEVMEFSSPLPGDIAGVLKVLDN